MIRCEYHFVCPTVLIIIFTFYAFLSIYAAYNAQKQPNVQIPTEVSRGGPRLFVF